MDHHSTTPVDPRVLKAMLPYFTEDFGNAASRNHVFGWKAEEAVERGREQVAAIIGGKARDVVFTSGATESINLALKGAMEYYQTKGDHVVTDVIEHKATLDCCKRLEKTGHRATYIPVGKSGIVDPEDVRNAITEKTVLVSVMFANNEIGTINPIAEIGKICREKGVLFHVDAAQAVGKVPVNVDEQNIDLLSASAHKLYGPKGIGALWVRPKPRIRLAPIIDGGGHERGMRSGTLNVPSIVGFGEACRLSQEELPEESARLLALRTSLLSQLRKNLDEIHVNGDLEHRLPGNLNVSFAYVEGEALLLAIKDVAVSSGSACTSASLEPSYVLLALGLEMELAHTSIRFGIGRFNTQEEIDFVAALVSDKVRKLREMSPLYEMVKEGIDLKTVKWAAEH
ncbi:MAG: IscS subfamily cysteine desulfurase [Acidobacteriota bacterium]